MRRRDMSGSKYAVKKVPDPPGGKSYFQDNPRRRNPSGFGYRVKGFKAGLTSTKDMYDYWHAHHGKQSGSKSDEHLYLDGKPVARGAYVTAQEYFFEGFQRGREARDKKRLSNPRGAPVAFTVKGRRHTGKAKLVGGKVKIFVTPGVARKINPKMKVYTFRYGDNWLAARGGRTAKYRSSSEEMAIKQFKLAHPYEPHWKIVKVGSR